MLIQRPKNTAIPDHTLGEAQGKPFGPAKVQEAVDDVLDPINAPNGATVEIPTPPKNAELIQIWWLSDDGVVDVLEHKFISEDDKGKPVEFRISNEIVMASLNKAVTISYEIRLFENDKVVSGEDYKLRVESQAFKFGPAKVQEAVDDVLDPANAPNGATVEIPFNSSVNAGDSIQIWWLSDDGVVDELVHKTIDEDNKGKPIEFQISNEIVMLCLNQTVTISYDVILLEGGGRPGEIYKLRVESQAFKFGPAKVQEAVDDVLDPANAPNGATVEIPFNSSVNAGDSIQIWWLSDDGVADELVHKIIDEDNKGKPIEFQISNEIVMLCLNQTVTISYDVILLEGGGGPGEIYKLRVESQAFKLPAATFKEAT